MKQVFDISLLSKYRPVLMGIAMFWVIWMHSQLETGILVLDTIKRTGFGGVDIFLFLSGLGLFFSLNKDSNIKNFYKKRVLRILPYYIPVVFLFSLFLVFHDKMNPAIILYNVTTLSFWVNYTGVPFLHGFDWYIPSLLFLYAITPFYYRLFVKNPILYTVLFSLIGIVISVLISGTQFCHLLTLTTRFPVYFMGVLCGYFILHNKVKINMIWAIVLLVMMCIGFASLLAVYKFYAAYSFTYGLIWYPFIMITFPLLLLLTALLKQFPNNRFRILSFAGKYSLVIYLLHERLLKVLNIFSVDTKSLIIINFIAIIFTFMIGYYYQNFIDKIIDKKKR